MSEEGVPDTVLQFVGRHIESLEQLEILLLLHSNPGAVWTVKDIFQKIQSSQASVQQRLEQLQAAGLIVAEGKGYQFNSSAEEAEAVTALAENYKLRRVRVIEAIYAPRKQDAAQSFADAFKLRRKD